LIRDRLRAFACLAQHLQARILIKVSDCNAERQTPVIDLPVMAQHGVGNCGHLIEVIAARVDHGQFRLAHVLGIIPGVAICQLHMTLHREQIGEQTSSQHDD
jgi:hypothetical protein